ncbi:50S ribosomal protein L25 [Candidatus Nomurabacteria bacterium]|nr:50S ribosomal protein L25 [Candidatus Nomurabacteria bacterium]
MELTVNKRETTQNPNTLRREGFLPAVIYGCAAESTPVTIDRKTFQKVYKAAGESSVITIKGLGEDKDALIHDVQHDAVTGEPLHADFYAIQKGQTVTVSVPLEFDGVAPAVKDLGGILTKVMHELEITVQPKDLPHAIHVDISALKTLEDQIKVSDLKLPASAEISADPEEVVAMVSTATEEPAEPAAPIDLSAIAISEERGKKEEEAPAEGETKE